MKIVVIDLVYSDETRKILDELSGEIKNSISQMREYEKLYKKKIQLESLDIITDFNIGSINFKSQNFKNYDVFVIISNQILSFEKCINGIKNKTKSILLTENLESSYIKRCVELIPNVCYIKNSLEKIVKRIVKVYGDCKIEE